MKKKVLSVILLLVVFIGTVFNANADTGYNFTYAVFVDDADDWNDDGLMTKNLIVNVTPPDYSIDAGADKARWQDFWNNTMVKSGFGSAYISGDDDALQVYKTTALDGTETFAIRPVDAGGVGSDANLGGEGDTEDDWGGISYIISLGARDMARASNGYLDTYSYGEFYRQEGQSYHHTMACTFYNARWVNIDHIRGYEKTAKNGAEDGYLAREGDRISVPAGTKYIRYWFINVGSGNHRKSVKNLQAYLVNTTPHKCDFGTTDVCSCGRVNVSSKTFPDASFRSFITTSISGASNNILNKNELSAVEKIDASNKGIESLKGIEFFTNLKELDCSYNSLTSLDVSKNTELTALNCETNQLNSLNVRSNTKLKTLACKNNRLTHLDLSKNALTLWDTVNTQSTTVDMDGKITYIMPTGFDSSKVSNVTGGSFDGNVLTVDNGVSKVTYKYATGMEKVNLSVTLNIKNAGNKNIQMSSLRWITGNSYMNLGLDIFLENTSICKMIVAIYDNKDRIIGVSAEDVYLTENYAYQPIIVNFTGVPNYVKAFLLNDTANIKPLAQNFIYYFNQK